MAKSSVYEGKSYDEAVKKGLDDLGLTRAEATITLVEEGKGGFLGFGSRPYRVSIMRRPGGAVREPEERGERRVQSSRRDEKRGGRGGRDRDRNRSEGQADRPREGQGDRPREGQGGRDRDRKRGAPQPVVAAKGDAPRGERPERPERGERPDRGERPERGERPGRGERRPDRSREDRPREERPARPVPVAATQPPPQEVDDELMPLQAGAPAGGESELDAEGQRRRRRRGRRGGRGRRRGGPEGDGPRQAGDDMPASNGVALAEPDSGYDEPEVMESAPMSSMPSAPPVYEPPVAAPAPVREEAPMREPMPAREALPVREYAPVRAESPARETPRGRSHEGSEPSMSPSELAETSKSVTEKLLKAMGFEATVTVTVDGDRADVTAEVAQDDDLLTGQKGEVRQAMQHLLNRFLNRGEGSRYHLQLEINDFWQRREDELAALARSLAEDAVAKNAEMVTEYLNSQERRIVHVTLREDTRVKTFALGTGMIKRVAVAPADFPERTGEEDAG